MSIEFPRPFPDGVHLATTQFDFREIVRTSPLGDGGCESVNQWAARWRGAWRTQWLAGEQLGAMQAWLSSLRNGGRSFLGRETGRAALAGHVSGLGGSPAITTITALDEIAIEGLPAGAALRAGDRFAVSQIVSTIRWRALCQVEEDATADGSGDLAALKFSPPLPAGIFTAAAELDFAAPSALMKLTPGSISQEQFGARLRYAFAGEQIWGVPIPPVTGSLSVRENGSDDFTGTGSVIVSAAIAAREGGADEFSGVGAVFVSGSMAARESGSDGFAGSGSLAISGSMAARETGPDIFVGTGIVGNPVIGSMAVQEGGSDSFTGVGAVLVSGSMAAQETGGDRFSGTGAVLASGSMAVRESGGDTLAGTGAVVVSGTMAAQEVGADSFSGSGELISTVEKFTALGAGESAGVSTTHVVSGAALGSGFTHIVAVFGWLTINATRTVSSATIDGETASVVDQQHNGEGSYEQGMAIIIAPASGNASGDISVTFNGLINNPVGFAWFGVNLDSATPVATAKRMTNADGSAANLATTADGFIVAVSVSDAGSNISDTVLDNLTSYSTTYSINMRTAYLSPTSGETVAIDATEDWMAASFH